MDSKKIPEKFIGKKMKKYIFYKIKILLMLLPQCISNCVANLLTAIIDKNYNRFMTKIPSARNKINEKLDGNKMNRILIIRLDAVGDMIWTTAFIRELSKCCPTAKIDIVVRPVIKELLVNCPYINNIYTYECTEIRNVLPCKYMTLNNKAKDYISKNMDNAYDVVFLPRLLSYGSAIENELLALNLTSDYVVTRGYSIDLFEKIRINRIRKKFSYVVEHQKVIHEVECILSLLDVFNNVIAPCNEMELWFNGKEKIQAINILPDNIKQSTTVAVALVGAEKCRNWPVEKYECLFHKIYEVYGNDVIFVLCGGRDANIYAKKIKYCPNVVDITSKTSLLQVAEIIASCDIYLGSDTGLMHMAAVGKTPILEISNYLLKHTEHNMWQHNGAYPVRVGPWKVDNEVIQPNHGIGWCVEQCDFPESHCIATITVEQVETQLVKFLNKYKRDR